MALAALGVFYGGVITGIPTVTGVAQGVHHQKEKNKEAANETRMVKFHLDVFCGAKSSKRDEVDGTVLVLRKDKVWLAPQDAETRLPKAPKPGKPVAHPFTGFYIMYPDEDRDPPERGLVSTISVDPPMLNWIYVDKDTLEVKYGNRTASIKHIVGPWDWTDDEAGLTLDGWEGFVAVEEEEDEESGLKWALYYDKWDNRLDKGERVNGRRVLECSIERRTFSTEQQQEDNEKADQKLQVKTAGDLKTKWG